MPKKSFAPKAPEKSWKSIIDSWMRNRHIRRPCLIFLGFALVISFFVVVMVLAAVVVVCLTSAGGIGSAISTVASTPTGWIAASVSGAAGAGGVAGIRRVLRRRREVRVQMGDTESGR